MDGHRRPAPKDALSDERVRELVLAEVLRDTEMRQVEREVWTPPPGTTAPRIVLAALTTVVAAWLWIFPPAFLQPPGVVQPSLERVEAGLQVAVALQVDRIEQFRRETGRLPDRLDEAGEPLPGMTYTRVNAQVFRLRGRKAESVILYESGDSMTVLMRNALRTLRDTP